jgi:predicted nucleic acid-binding protein
MPVRLPKVGPERLFIDTNVFLRYLTNDVPEQADAVERLLIQAMQGDVILVTNSLVIAEIVWALDSFYRVSRPSSKHFSRFEGMEVCSPGNWPLT